MIRPFKYVWTDHILCYEKFQSNYVHIIVGLFKLVERDFFSSLYLKLIRVSFFYSFLKVFEIYDIYIFIMSIIWKPCFLDMKMNIMIVKLNIEHQPLKKHITPTFPLCFKCWWFNCCYINPPVTWPNIDIKYFWAFDVIWPYSL